MERNRNLFFPLTVEKLHKCNNRIENTNKIIFLFSKLPI